MVQTRGRPIALQDVTRPATPLFTKTRATTQQTACADPPKKNARIQVHPPHAKHGTQRKSVRSEEIVTSHPEKFEVDTFAEEVCTRRGKWNRQGRGPNGCWRVWGGEVTGEGGRVERGGVFLFFE